MIIFTVSVEACNWDYQAQSKTKGPGKGACQVETLLLLTHLFIELYTYRNAIKFTK